MAAFFAMMGRTIIGKYVPILLAVTVFVAANFQHSPANMLGAALLVAAPFWYVFRPTVDATTDEAPVDG